MYAIVGEREVSTSWILNGDALITPDGIVRYLGEIRDISLNEPGLLGVGSLSLINDDKHMCLFFQKSDMQTVAAIAEYLRGYPKSYGDELYLYECRKNQLDTASRMRSPSFCPRCGSKLVLDANFCTACGNKISGFAQAPSPSDSLLPRKPKKPMAMFKIDFTGSTYDGNVKLKIDNKSSTKVTSKGFLELSLDVGDHALRLSTEMMKFHISSPEDRVLVRARIKVFSEEIMVVSE